MGSSNPHCRLCHNVAPLRDSHVIPEFCFKPTYDSIHRAIEFSLSAESRRYIQKGFREPLFCDDCEQRFGKLDTYFSNEWFQKNKLPDRVESDLIEITGLDYTTFKLFHHSILFRASVSTLEQFKFVKLGKNEEILRQMLLTGDASDENQFPFITQFLFHPDDRRVASDIIVEPELSRPNGHYVYIFVYAGCCWMYYASKTDSTRLIQHVFSSAGTLYLVPQSIYQIPRIATFAKNYRSTTIQDAQGAK